MSDATHPTLPFETVRPESRLDRPEPTVTAAGAGSPFPPLATGIPALDELLGGGLARGTVVDVFGPADACHLDVGFCVMRATLRASGAAMLSDGARTFDPVEAVKDGLDVGRLCVSQPDTLEQAFECVEAVARSGAIDLIVVNGLPPSEVPAPPGEEGVVDREMNAQARFFSERLGTLAGVCSRSGTTLVFLRELAEGEMDPSGPAVSFHARTRINVFRREGVVHARVTKHPTGGAGREAILTADT